MQLWKQQTCMPPVVYTDASLMNNTRDTFMETLRGAPGNCRATAAVVLTEDPTNPNLPVRCLRATTEDPDMGATSFTVELAAISIAGQMGREDGRAQVCVTDSESSMKHIANKTKKPGSCPGYLSETARHGWDEVEGRTVRFQKSHAERRGKSDTWQRDEWGNHLADSAAGAEDLEEVASVAGHRFVGEELELAGLLRQMMPEGQWYWGRVDGQVSFLGGPLQQIQKNRLRKYLKNRESTQTDSVMYAWSTVNLGWTSRVWSFSTRSTAEIGLIQRLVLDWHWDGRNANKGTGHEDMLMCPWCRGRDSQQHWMTDCTEARLVAGRADMYSSAVKYLKTKSKRFEEIGQAVLEYAAGANHGNRVLLGLWEGDAMEWLGRRVEEAPGDGTTEAQLESFMLGFHRHMAMDVLDLWEIRSGVMKKHKKEVINLTLASLRQEVAAEEAAELMEEATLLGRQREVDRGTEAAAIGHNIGYDRRVQVPTRVYDTWQPHQAAGSVQLSNRVITEGRDDESEGDRGDDDAGKEVGIDAVLAHAGSMTTGVTGGVEKVAGAGGADLLAATTGSTESTGGAEERLPGYLQGVDLAVLPVSMWIPAGADRYHLAHQRDAKVYIAKSKISDSMWGLFSGRDQIAIEGDVMCDYHGVRYKYNVMTAKEKPLAGNDYVWYNGGKGSSAVIIDGQARYSSYGRYANEGKGDANAEIVWRNKKAWVVVLQGCVISPGDEILIQYGWDYWKDFLEDDMVREEMRVYYDSLKTPAERHMDAQVETEAAIQAEKLAQRQEAQLARQAGMAAKKVAAAQREEARQMATTRHGKRTRRGFRGVQTAEAGGAGDRGGVGVGAGLRYTGVKWGVGQDKGCFAQDWQVDRSIGHFFPTMPKVTMATAGTVGRTGGGAGMEGRISLSAGRVEMDTVEVAGDREHRESMNPAVHAEMVDADMDTGGQPMESRVPADRMDMDTEDIDSDRVHIGGIPAGCMPEVRNRIEDTEEGTVNFFTKMLAATRQVSVKVARNGKTRGRLAKKAKAGATGGSRSALVGATCSLVGTTWSHGGAKGNTATRTLGREEDIGTVGDTPTTAATAGDVNSVDSTSVNRDSSGYGIVGDTLTTDARSEGMGMDIVDSMGMGIDGDALATEDTLRDINVVENCMNVCVNDTVDVNVHVVSGTARVVGEALTSAEVRGKLI